MQCQVVPILTEESWSVCSEEELGIHPDLYGMLYIPAGGFTMGQSDQDVPFAQYTRAKTVSVQAFYMDQTEISNNEYRQFVYWVRDSLARRLLSRWSMGPDGWTIPVLDDALEEKDESEWILRLENAIGLGETC